MCIIIYICNDCVQCYVIKWVMENWGFDFEMINVDCVFEVVEVLCVQGFCQLLVVIVGDFSWFGFCLDMINCLYLVLYAVSV